MSYRDNATDLVLAGDGSIYELDRLRRIERAARKAVRAYGTFERPPWKELTALCKALQQLPYGCDSEGK